MPRFVGLFDAPEQRVAIVDDDAGNRTLERNEVTEAIFDFDQEGTAAEHLRLTPNAEGLLFVPERGKYPVIFTPNDEYTGETVQLAVMTDELEGLIAYLQKLGMNRGKWRDLFEPQQLEASAFGMPRSEEWIAHGKEVYERRCAGCHGVTGDGNGPAATFMYKFRPRNFQLAVFKFRHVKGPLPTDGDLMRTITRGVRGTAMPPWHTLPVEDRLAVIQYIKYELAVDRSDPSSPYAYFVDEPPGQPLYIGTPPPPTQQLLDRGKEVWRQAKCWECHGDARQGRRRQGGRAQGRPQIPDPPGRPYHRPVQVGAGGGGHLPDHEHRALRHADAVLQRFPARGGPLGVVLLRPCACRRSRTR